MNKCLLLKRNDNRKFLVKEKYLQNVIEYAKTFSSEIWTVHTEAKGMELKALAQACCKVDYDEDLKFELLDKIYPISKKKRDTILKDAAVIRKFVRKRLLSGKPLSLKELKDKYKNCKVTDACLCNHLATVRRDLSQEGHRFKKVGAGNYCLVESSS